MKYDEKLLAESLNALKAQVLDPEIKLEGTHIDSTYDDSWSDGYDGTDPYVYYYRIKTPRKTKEVALFWEKKNGNTSVLDLALIGNPEDLDLERVPGLESWTIEDIR